MIPDMVDTKEQINFGSDTGKYSHYRNVIVERMLDRFQTEFLESLVETGFQIEFLESLVETGFSFLCKRIPRIYHAVFEIIDDQMLMACHMSTINQQCCEDGIFFDGAPFRHVQGEERVINWRCLWMGF
jgi:hypothetical protein